MRRAGGPTAPQQVALRHGRGTVERSRASSTRTTGAIAQAWATPRPGGGWRIAPDGPRHRLACVGRPDVNGCHDMLKDARDCGSGSERPPL